MRPESIHTVQIARDSMEVHEALNNTAKPMAHSRGAVMKMPAQELLDVMKFGSQALGNSFAKHCEAFAFPGLAADMRETQEIEGFRFALPTTTPINGRETAKLDQPSLVGVERKAEALQPYLKSFRKRRASQRCWNPRTKSSA